MSAGQAKFQRKIELFTTNGQRSEVQTYLAQVGYDPTVLTEAKTDVKTWEANRQQMQALLGDQKGATQTQKAARKAARREMVALAKTIRILFGQDEPTLTMLGLLPQASETTASRETTSTETSAQTSEAAATGESTVPSDSDQAASTTDTPSTTEKATRSSRKRSHSLAADIDRWRLLCANIGQLSQSQRDRLAVADWAADRVAAAVALVEALAEAHAAQQAAIDAYRSHSAMTKNQEKALRKWYSEASRLVKLVIKRLNSEQQTRFEAMLGF